MGGCVTGSHKRAGEQLATLASIPTDVHTINQTDLPTLKFSFLLEDVKIRRCEYKEIGLKFKVEDVDQYSTSFRRVDASMKVSWRVSHRMECKMNEYQLRLKFLIVEAYDRKKALLGSLKINLYLIWRGPYHINLPLSLPDSSEARIAFNFKISQSVHLVIENTETVMLPNTKKDSKELYTFWIEPIINQQLQPAKHSYFLRIDDGKNAITKHRNTNLYKEQSESEQDLITKNMHLEKDITQVYSTGNDLIVWSKDKAKEFMLPKIDTIMYTHELRYTTLYLIFFHVVKEKAFNFQIDSSSYISLSKLMAQESTVWKDETTRTTYELYDVTLKQKTYLHGKETGEAKVTLKMKVQSYEQQMLTCVRTQNGIETSSPIFTTSKLKESEEISTIKKLSTGIQKDLTELQNLGQGHPTEAKELITDIKSDLTKMIKLLQKTSKDSSLLYEYLNQMEMIEGQRVLIDVSFKAIAYIRQRLHPEVEQLSWQILSLIIRRGEFSLNFIGFSKDQRQSIFHGKMDDLLSKKISVGVKYLELLNQMLEGAFKSLVNEGEEAERSFVQSFCSYAYFRIPIFREHILAVITKSSDPQIEEWRNITFSLTNHSHSRQAREHLDFYSVCFDWEHNFYKCLSADADFKSGQLWLRRMMKTEHGWKDRIARRRGAFFTFLENLVKEIQYVCVISKYIQWEYLPGYSRLLYAFLAELKMIKISHITDRLKRCLLQMLSNERLLNVFVVMLLKKTNVFEAQSTMATLSIIDQIFKKLKKSERAIPTTFDYKFFLQGLKVVLDSDYEYNVEKALILLYNHFNYFCLEFSLELILYLMSKYFFRFFFHWSFSLRETFHTLIYTKVHMLREKEEGSIIMKKPSKSKEKKGKTSKTEIQQTPYISFLKIFIIQRFQFLMRVVRENVLPSVMDSEAKSFIGDSLYKNMRLKLSMRQISLNGGTSSSFSARKNSSDTLAPIRFFSSGINKKMIVTKHKIYFTPEEMEVVFIEKTQRIYVKSAVAEYKAVMEKLEKQYLENPDYQPELKPKKIKDEREKDLEEIQLDEW